MSLALCLLVVSQTPQLFTKNWLIRTLPVSDRQHDDGISAAGMPTIRQPQASILARGDSGGEKAFKGSLGDLQCSTAVFVQRSEV